MARELIVRLIGDDDALLRTFRRSSAEASRFSRQVEGALGSRAGGVAASFESLGSKIRANPLMAGLAGGTALAGLKRITDAAKESEVVMGQTQVAVEGLGLAWEENAGRIEAAADAISRASAFDDEAVLKSFQVLIRSTGDVDRALQLTTLATNLARAREGYVDLAGATQLVNKASLGQVGALRRVGIAIDANASSTEALALLQQRFSGAAAKYTDSASGATDRLNVAMENLSESAGGLLTPALVVVADALTDVSRNVEVAVTGIGVLGEQFRDLAEKIPDPGGKLGGFVDMIVEIGKRTNPLTGPMQLWADAIRLVGLNSEDAAPKVEGLTRAAEDFRAAISLRGLGGQTIFSNPLVPDAKTPTSVVVDPTAGLDALMDGIRGVPAIIAAVQEEVEAKFRAAQQATEKQRDAFETLMGRLGLRIDMAGATGNLKAQLAGLKEQERVLLEQVKVEGHTVELDRRLFDIRQERARLVQDARSARQFQALGLAADGSEKIPGVDALRKRLGSITERVKGTALDTNKTSAQLQRIGKVLSGQFGKVGSDVRDAIRRMFDDIAGALKDGGRGDVGNLTKTTSLYTKKIVEGLGLSVDEAKRIRARLSGFNSAGIALAGTSMAVPGRNLSTASGTEDRNLTVTVQLDGDVFDRAVVRAGQKYASRNPRQKRGPNA